MQKQKIEEREKKYFLILFDIFRKNIGELECGFNSKENIRRDYENLGYKENDVEKGAERVLQDIISKNTFWRVNSAPISSDLFFELKDAMINIDAKTYKEKHQEHNKINVGANQISYGQHMPMTSKGSAGQKYTWKAALRKTYQHKKYGEIPCLTYFVKFIYDDNTKLLKKAELVNVPNGELQSDYGNIFGRGKSSLKVGKSARDIRVVINKFETPKYDCSWKRREVVYPSS